MGAQGRRRLSGVGRGASVSLTADRRKQLSGMDAAQIDGHHLWREHPRSSPVSDDLRLLVAISQALELRVQVRDVPPQLSRWAA